MDVIEQFLQRTNVDIMICMADLCTVKLYFYNGSSGFRSLVLRIIVALNSDGTIYFTIVHKPVECTRFCLQIVFRGIKYYWSHGRKEVKCG